MHDLVLTQNKFDLDGYWRKPVGKLLYIPTLSDVELFDQNGYDLTILEQHFASTNASQHREYHYALKKPWFTQPEKIEGAVLNHSLLFERKGYADKAKEQLEHWARTLPMVHKILAIRPKWGLDFSIDYVDRNGNAFEILHWEYDGFNFDEIQQQKDNAEHKILSIDWDHAGKQLLIRKNEWHHLDFFSQSAWKCKYFGIVEERFKMVIWQ